MFNVIYIFSEHAAASRAVRKLEKRQTDFVAQLEDERRRNDQQKSEVSVWDFLIKFSNRFKNYIEFYIALLYYVNRMA